MVPGGKCLLQTDWLIPSCTPNLEMLSHQKILLSMGRFNLGHYTKEKKHWTQTLFTFTVFSDFDIWLLFTRNKNPHMNKFLAKTFQTAPLSLVEIYFIFLSLPQLILFFSLFKGFWDTGWKDSSSCFLWWWWPVSSEGTGVYFSEKSME